MNSKNIKLKVIALVVNTTVGQKVLLVKKRLIKKLVKRLSYLLENV